MSKQFLWLQDGDDLFNLKIPYDVSSITFSEFCDFQTEERAYIELRNPPELKEDGSNREEVDNFEPDLEDCMRQLTKAVGTMIDGDISRLPFTIVEDRVDALIDGGYKIGLEDDLSVLRIYAHLLTVIRNFKPLQIPETFTTDFKGEVFEITYKRASQMLTGKAVSVGEAVEVLEYQRRLQLLLKERPLEIGNLDFTLGLTEISLLLRKPGERLPWDRTKLNEFIQDRRELFKDLSLEVVLSIRFFLLNTLLRYEKTQTINSFGKVLRKSEGRNLKRGEKQTETERSGRK